MYLILHELILISKNAVHYTTKYDLLSQNEISSHLILNLNNLTTAIIEPKPN